MAISTLTSSSVPVHSEIALAITYLDSLCFFLAEKALANNKKILHLSFSEKVSKDYLSPGFLPPAFYTLFFTPFNSKAYSAVYKALS